MCIPRNIRAGIRVRAVGGMRGEEVNALVDATIERVAKRWDASVLPAMEARLAETITAELSAFLSQFDALGVGGKIYHKKKCSSSISSTAKEEATAVSPAFELALTTSDDLVANSSNASRTDTPRLPQSPQIGLTPVIGAAEQLESQLGASPSEAAQGILGEQCTQNRAESSSVTRQQDGEDPLLDFLHDHETSQMKKAAALKAAKGKPAPLAQLHQIRKRASAPQGYLKHVPPGLRKNFPPVVPQESLG